MDPSNSCIQHDVKIKEEPIDEDNESSSDQDFSHLKNGWFEFKCESGKVLFYFNVATNEHLWIGNSCTCSKENVEEVNSESIGIQCDIDDKCKHVLSKDVTTEIDFSILGVQESQHAVSVQTEVSFLQDKYFKDVGVMTFSEDESILPLEIVSTERNPLIHHSNEELEALDKNACDPEDTKDSTLNLDNSLLKSEHFDRIGDDEVMNEDVNANVLSQLDDGKNSDDENSLKRFVSPKNSDFKNPSEEKSSASSCETENEQNEGSCTEMIVENTVSNEISEKNSEESDSETSLTIYSDDDGITSKTSENRDLSQVEILSVKESSDVFLHDNCPSKHEQLEQGGDSRPSNEAFQVENLNAAFDISIEKDLRQEDSCLSFEENMDAQNSYMTPRNRGNLHGDGCNLENEKPKEDQHEESEQSATRVTCQKNRRQTARKCADSFRKCLLIPKKLPRLSNTENSTQNIRRGFRKRTLKKGICTERFSKRLKVLVTPLEQDLPRIEGQLKSTRNTSTNDTAPIDKSIHSVKHDHSYFCLEDDRRSQSEHEVSESETEVLSNNEAGESACSYMIPKYAPTSIEPQNGFSEFPDVQCIDENKQPDAGLGESNKPQSDVNLEITNKQDISERLYSSDTDVSRSESDLKANEDQRMQSSSENQTTQTTTKNYVRRKRKRKRIFNLDKYLYNLKGKNSINSTNVLACDQEKAQQTRNVDNAEDVNLNIIDERHVERGHEDLQANDDEAKANKNEFFNDHRIPETSSEDLPMDGDDVSKERQFVEQNVEDEIQGADESEPHSNAKNCNSSEDQRGPHDNIEHKVDVLEEQTLVDGDHDVSKENKVVEKCNEDEFLGTCERDPLNNPTNKGNSSEDQLLVDGDPKLAEGNQTVEKPNEDEVPGEIDAHEPHNESKNKGNSSEDQLLVGDREISEGNQIAEKPYGDGSQSEADERWPHDNLEHKVNLLEGQTLLDGGHDVSKENEVGEKSNEDDLLCGAGERDPLNKPKSIGNFSEEQLLVYEGRKVSETNQIVENPSEDEFSGEIDAREPHNESKNREHFSGDQSLVDREVSEENQESRKSIVEGFSEDDSQDKGNQYEPKDRPENPDINRQENLSIMDSKSTRDKKEKDGISENDERYAQGTAKDETQNLEDVLKDLMDENGRAFNGNYFQDRNIHERNDGTLNKATCSYRLIENDAEDIAIKEEPEEASGKKSQNRKIEKNKEYDIQIKAKEITQTLDDNQETSPTTDKYCEVSIEFENKNGNSEDVTETKIGERKARDEAQNQDQGRRMLVSTLKDDNGGMDNDESQKEAECRQEYLPGVEGSGQGSNKTEQLSHGKVDICILTNECASEEMSERGDNKTSSITNSQSYDLNSSIKPLTEKDAVRCPSTRCGRSGLKCKICGKGFKSRRKLSFHMRGHDRANKKTCRLCLRTFRSYSLLCDHLKYHNMVSKYRCSYCNESFISHQKLVSHFIKCSETKTMPQNSSSVADTAKYAASSSDTSPLKNDHQMDKVTSPATNKLKCKICNMEYVYPARFKKHLDLHADKANGPANNKASKRSYKSFENHVSNVNSERKSMWKDETISQSNSSRAITSGDSKDVSGEIPLKCPVCGMHFKKEYWLNCHFKKNHEMAGMESSTVLEDVKVPANSNEEVSESQIISSGDNKDVRDESTLDCPVCGMHFKKEYWLNCHVKKKHEMYDMESSTVLEDMEVPANSNEEVSGSQIISSGDNKDVSDKSTLDCPVCGMHFKKEYWLNCHVKKKHEMYDMESSTVLEDVEVPANSNEEVSESQIISSGDNKDVSDKSTLDCPVCGMHFKKEYWLNCHVKKKHEIYDMESSTVLEDVKAPTNSNEEVPESQIISFGNSKDVSDERLLDCPVCGMHFKKEYWLNCHVKKKHEMYAMESSTETILPETNRGKTNQSVNDAKENPRCRESQTSPKTMVTESTNSQINRDVEMGEDTEKLVGSPLKCKACGIQFKRGFWYNFHMKKKHGMSQERFVSSSAPQSPETKRNETNGIWKNRKDTKEPKENHVPPQGRTAKNVAENGLKHSEDKKAFNCDICNRGFVYFRRLETHIKQKHPGLEKRNNTNKTMTVASDEVPEKTKVTNLETVFEVRKNAGKSGNSFLEAEVRSNDGNVIGYKQNNFKCCECPDEFPHLDDLIKHNSAKHVVRKCSHCQASCSTEELDSHMKIHRRQAGTDGMKKICCKICGKEVSTALELITHFRTHKKGRKRKINETKEEEKESATKESTRKEDEPSGSTSCDAPNSKTGTEGFVSPDREETLSKRTIQNVPESSSPTISNPTSKNNIRLSVFFCVVCNKAFSSLRKRASHVQRSHRIGKKSKVFERIVETEHEIPPDKACRYNCSTCGQGFRNLQLFNQHKFEHVYTPPIEPITDTNDPSIVSRNALEEDEMLQNTDGCIPRVKLFSKSNTPAITGDVSIDTDDVGRKYDYPKRKHWKCSICGRCFYKAKSYNHHKCRHDDFQSTEQPHASGNTSRCIPTEMLPSQDINTPVNQDNLPVPGKELDPISRKDQSPHSPGMPQDTTKQEEVSKISNIETICEDKNVAGTESLSVCYSETSSTVTSANKIPDENYSPSKSVFQYLNLETHSCGNLAGNKYKCFYCSLSFGSFYARNSHIFSVHKMKLQQSQPQKAPDSLMETNKGTKLQATSDTSPQMTLKECESTESIDNEFNSIIQDANER